MTSRPERQPRSPLAFLLHKFRDQLGSEAESCSDDAQLKAVLEVICEADAYLSRSLSATLVAYANGGSIPAPEYPPKALSVMVQEAIDALPAEQAELKQALTHWNDLQKSTMEAGARVLGLAFESKQT